MHQNSDRRVDRAAVVAVDPGRDKCGLAMLGADGQVLRRAIVPRERAAEIAAQWARGADAVVVGRATTGREVARELEAAGVQRVEMADEKGTSLQARELYWLANPPCGWRRLVPRSFLVPPVPVDDWAAVALGRRYLKQADG